MIVIIMNKYFIMMMMILILSIVCEKNSKHGGWFKKIMNSEADKKVPWYLNDKVVKKDRWHNVAFKKLSTWWPNRYQCLPQSAKFMEDVLLLYFSLTSLSLLDIKIQEMSGSIVKATVDEHKDLLDAVHEAIMISDISLSINKLEVFVQKNSQNAMALSVILTSSKRIIVGSKILEMNLPKPLLVSLILHELSHIKDRYKNTIVGICYTFASLKCFPSFDRYAQFDERIFIPKYLLIPLQLFYQRRNEYLADCYAATYCGEKSVILMLQAVAGIPLWLIRLQHLTGLIIPYSILIQYFPLPDHDGDIFDDTNTHPSLKRRIQRLNDYGNQRRNFDINTK